MSCRKGSPWALSAMLPARKALKAIHGSNSMLASSPWRTGALRSVRSSGVRWTVALARR
jgi:hypothetical protein